MPVKFMLPAASVFLFCCALQSWSLWMLVWWKEHLFWCSHHREPQPQTSPTSFSSNATDLVTCSGSRSCIALAGVRRRT